MSKKDLDFWEAFNKYNISLFGDADKDKIPNAFDCKPLDPNKDGIFGRALNVISRGKYGQTKEDYETEQTLKRIEQKRQLEYKMEKQKAINAMIQQKLDLQKLKAKEQQLLLKQQLQAQSIPRRSTTKEAISLIFGIPIQNAPLQRPGYYIESTGPKLPKGYRWKKIPKEKSKKIVSRPLICPHCGLPLIPGSGYMGQPVFYCPRCGFVTA